MGEPAFQIRPLDESTWPAFAALVEHNNGIFGGCWCLGWAQFGPPDEVVRIKNRAAVEKEQTSQPDWRIGCCYVGKGHRRQGVLAAGLAGALDLIADLGDGTVEGYPEPSDAVSPSFLYHGSLATFERLGFTRVRQIGTHRWVVTRTVEPTS